MAEYGRLERALALDAPAALMSASWGLGQVMGFHASDLGYGSVEQFVRRMVESEDAQLDALAAFIPSPPCSTRPRWTCASRPCWRSSPTSPPAS